MHLPTPTDEQNERQHRVELYATAREVKNMSRATRKYKKGGGYNARRTDYEQQAKYKDRERKAHLYNWERNIKSILELLSTGTGPSTNWSHHGSSIIAAC